MASRCILKQLRKHSVLKPSVSLNYVLTQNNYCKMVPNHSKNNVTCNLARIEQRRYLPQFPGSCTQLFPQAVTIWLPVTRLYGTVPFENPSSKLSVGQRYGLHIEKFYADIDSGRSDFTFDYFEELERQVTEEKHSKSKVFQSIVMKKLLSEKNIDTGKCFMDYLIKKERDILFTTRISYLQLLGETNENYKYDDIIYAEYKRILEMVELEYCEGAIPVTMIYALSSTRQYKKSLEILEVAKKNSKISFEYYYPILMASLKSGEFELFNPLMEEVFDTGSFSETNPYFKAKLQTLFETYLTSCKEKGVSVLNFLDLLGRLELYPDESVARNIKRTLEIDYGWKGEFSMVNSRGICNSCGVQLQKQTQVNKEDFNLLRNSFLDRTVHKGGSYYWSSPAELERFNKFLEQHKQFDVVVDILNVVLTNSKKMPKQKMAQFVVDQLSKTGQRVLMITRSHFQPKIYNAKIFVCDDKTSDDFFTLYAALYSGPFCKFVSNDFLRDCKFKLGEDVKNIFTRWQRTRQIRHTYRHIDTYNSTRNTLFFWYPKSYEARAQETEEGWHIPYTPTEIKIPYDVPKTFLCIRKK